MSIQVINRTQCSRNRSSWFLHRNQDPVASLVAIDNIIAGLRSHQNPDMELGRHEGLGGGSPDELTVGLDAKNVKRWNHGTVKCAPRHAYTTSGRTCMFKSGQTEYSQDAGAGATNRAGVGAAKLVEVRDYQGAAEIHQSTLATMRQPELLPRTTDWYSRFSDSRTSNLG